MPNIIVTMGTELMPGNNPGECYLNMRAIADNTMDAIGLTCLLNFADSNAAKNAAIRAAAVAEYANFSVVVSPTDRVDILGPFPE